MAGDESSAKHRRRQTIGARLFAGVERRPHRAGGVGVDGKIDQPEIDRSVRGNGLASASYVEIGRHVAVLVSRSRPASTRSGAGR